MRLEQPTAWLISLFSMSLTDHLHRKSDSIRAFLDERLVDFSPAREKWDAAQSGGPLVDADASSSWNLIGGAIDLRIRMMITPTSISVPPEERQIAYGTTFPSVLSELEAIQNRHGGYLGQLPPDEETHLLQVCYLLAMYDAFRRSSFASQRDSPLYTLKPGAKWRAHLNRVSENDVAILQTLVEPALELFTLAVGQRVSLGPVFADSHLVDGADGDLIVNGTLIEIKCEAPGFQSKAVRQVIAYALLDSTGEYELKKCSIYLARFGALFGWDLDQIIREVSQGRYGYELLRDEFHAWLVDQEEIRRRAQDVRAENYNRLTEGWRAMLDAQNEFVGTDRMNEDARRLAVRRSNEARMEMWRIEVECGVSKPNRMWTPFQE